MGISTIGGAGVALPPPQALFPSTVLNLPQVVGTNGISLPPGGDFLIPSGTFLVAPGLYSQVQILDPVTNFWRPYTTQTGNAPITVNSDGTNYRVINPTGFPIGAVVNNGGTAYTSAPAVAAGSGGSTWLAIVGGAVSAINVSTASSGANYSVPPLINIAAPPSPGVQATAVCAISGGAITGFTIVNGGAGYTSAPQVVIVPQQSDINSASTTVAVTNAKAVAQLSFVGQVTAVLLTNEGNNPLSAAPTLTFTGGGGSGVTATALMALTITGATVTTPGSGYATPVGLQAIGGTVTSAAASSNSTSISNGLLIPRGINFPAVIGSGTGIGVVNSQLLDGGLFTAPPSLVAYPGPGGTTPSALAVLTATVGGTNDTVFITPL